MKIDLIDIFLYFPNCSNTSFTYRNNILLVPRPRILWLFLIIIGIIFMILILSSNNFEL